MDKKKYSRIRIGIYSPEGMRMLGTISNQGQCVLFSVVFTPSPHSVWVLPVISLLVLAKIVSPVRACPGMDLPNNMMGEVAWDPKKEDDRGPLRVQSSLLFPIS
jgi:hypothetical protein